MEGAGQGRGWVRYEREYSNSMWHGGFKQLPDGRWLVAYMDDASRLITGFGVFDEASAGRAIEVLEKAAAERGRPASVMTGRGRQFYAGGRGHAGSEFEQKMAGMGMRHVLSGTGRRTGGKLARFYGEVGAKLHLFHDVDDLVDWWNNTRPHMSLDQDSLETPARAFARKAPGAGRVRSRAPAGPGKREK